MTEVDFLGNSKSPISVDGKDVNSLEELAKALKSISSENYSSLKQNLYTWIKEDVGDKKLARQMKNLLYQENAEQLIRNRVLSLKNRKKGIDPTDIQVNIKLYVNKVRLMLDIEKCFHCDVSHNVCPKEAVEVSVAENGEVLDISVDEGKCVLCGLCVPFCPSGCLSIEIDEKEDILLENYDSIPKLPDLETINDVEIKRLFTGSLTIDESKCPERCEHCVYACPTNAIRREGPRVLVDKNACTYCGACKNGCKYFAEDVIDLKRNAILYQGKEFTGFSAIWTDVIEEFLGKEKVNVVTNAKAMKKIIGLINKSDYSEYTKPMKHKMT